MSKFHKWPSIRSRARLVQEVRKARKDQEESRVPQARAAPRVKMDPPAPKAPKDPMVSPDRKGPRDRPGPPVLRGRPELLELAAQAAAERQSAPLAPRRSWASNSFRATPMSRPPTVAAS